MVTGCRRWRKAAAFPMRRRGFDVHSIGAEAGRFVGM